MSIKDVQPIKINADSLSQRIKREWVGGIMYEGRASRVSALTSQAYWQIKRIVTDGNEVIDVAYAGKGESTYIWDNRASYFPSVTPAFSNTKSLSLDGINDHAQIFSEPGVIAGIERTNAFSFFAWIKLDTSSGSR